MDAVRGSAVRRFTARRVRIPGSTGLALEHPCGICGAALAPYGSGVSLMRAMESGRASDAGEWRCARCRGITR
jgi:hypothetical protein